MMVGKKSSLIFMATLMMGHLVIKSLMEFASSTLEVLNMENMQSLF